MQLWLGYMMLPGQHKLLWWQSYLSEEIGETRWGIYGSLLTHSAMRVPMLWPLQATPTPKLKRWVDGGVLPSKNTPKQTCLLLVRQMSRDTKQKFRSVNVPGNALSDIKNSCINVDYVSPIPMALFRLSKLLPLVAISTTAWHFQP
jgi:hypothetical protein